MLRILVALSAIYACSGFLSLGSVKSTRKRQAGFQFTATTNILSTTSSRCRGLSTPLFAVGPFGTVDIGTGFGQFITLAYIAFSLVVGAKYVLQKIKNKEDLIKLK